MPVESAFCSATTYPADSAGTFLSSGFGWICFSTATSGFRWAILSSPLNKLQTQALSVDRLNNNLRRYRRILALRRLAEVTGQRIADDQVRASEGESEEREAELFRLKPPARTERRIQPPVALLSTPRPSTNSKSTSAQDAEPLIDLLDGGSWDELPPRLQDNLLRYRRLMLKELADGRGGSSGTSQTSSERNRGRGSRIRPPSSRPRSGGESAESLDSRPRSVEQSKTRRRNGSGSTSASSRTPRRRHASFLRALLSFRRRMSKGPIEDLDIPEAAEVFVGETSVEKDTEQSQRSRNRHRHPTTTTPATTTTTTIFTTSTRRPDLTSSERANRALSRLNRINNLLRNRVRTTTTEHPAIRPITRDPRSHNRFKNIANSVTFPRLTGRREKGAVDGHGPGNFQMTPKPTTTSTTTTTTTTTTPTTTTTTPRPRRASRTNLPRLIPGSGGADSNELSEFGFGSGSGFVQEPRSPHDHHTPFPSDSDSSAEQFGGGSGGGFGFGSVLPDSGFGGGFGGGSGSFGGGSGLAPKPAVTLTTTPAPAPADHFNAPLGPAPGGAGFGFGFGTGSGSAPAGLGSIFGPQPQPAASGAGGFGGTGTGFGGSAAGSGFGFGAESGFGQGAGSTGAATGFGQQPAAGATGSAFGVGGGGTDLFSGSALGLGTGSGTSGGPSPGGGGQSAGGSGLGFVQGLSGTGSAFGQPSGQQPAAGSAGTSFGQGTTFGGSGLIQGGPSSSGFGLGSGTGTSFGQTPGAAATGFGQGPVPASGTGFGHGTGSSFVQGGAGFGAPVPQPGAFGQEQGGFAGAGNALGGLGGHPPFGQLPSPPPGVDSGLNLGIDPFAGGAVPPGFEDSFGSNSVVTPPPEFAGFNPAVGGVPPQSGVGGGGFNFQGPQGVGSFQNNFGVPFGGQAPVAQSLGTLGQQFGGQPGFGGGSSGGQQFRVPGSQGNNFLQGAGFVPGGQPPRAGPIPGLGGGGGFGGSNGFGDGGLPTRGGFGSRFGGRGRPDFIPAENPESLDNAFNEVVNKLKFDSGEIDPTVIDILDVALGNGGNIASQARLVDKFIGFDNIHNIQTFLSATGLQEPIYKTLARISRGPRLLGQNGGARGAGLGGLGRLPSFRPPPNG